MPRSQQAAKSSERGALAGFGEKLSRIGTWIGVSALLLGQAVTGPPLLTPPEATPCDTIGAEVGASMCTTQNDLSLLVDGPQIRQEMLSQIENAKASLWLNVYEFQGDASAAEIADALIAAHARGVDVKIVVDNRHSSGQFNAPEAALGANVDRMIQAGIDVQQPKYPAYSVNHRKILVSDGARALVTGANIGGNYLLPRDNGWSYHDAAIAMRGPAVRDVARVFIASWMDAGGARLETPEVAPAVFNSPFSSAKVQIVSHKGGSDRNIEREYVQRIDASASRVVLVNGFAMSDSIKDALARAEARGVQVVWLWGQASADTAVMAEKGLNEVIASGGEVFRLSGPLHMKAAFFDDSHAILGSSNLDGFSMKRNDEVIVQVSSKDFVRHMIDRIVSPGIASATPIAHASGATTGDAKRDFVLRHILDPLVQ